MLFSIRQLDQVKDGRPPPMSTEDAQLFHITFQVRYGLSTLADTLRTSILSRNVFSTDTWHSPSSRIRHIETITRQPLQMAHRACNCWLFCISNEFNVLRNMEYDITYYKTNCRLLMPKLIRSARPPDRETVLNHVCSTTNGIRNWRAQIYLPWLPRSEIRE